MPSAAIVSRADVKATPHILVRATPGVPQLNGTLIASPVEGTLQRSISTIDIAVVGDRWADTLGRAAEGPEFVAPNQLLLEGIGDILTNDSAWDRYVLAELKPENVSRLDNITVRAAPRHATYSHPPNTTPRQAASSPQPTKSC